MEGWGNGDLEFLLGMMKKFYSGKITLPDNLTNNFMLPIFLFLRYASIIHSQITFISLGSSTIFSLWPGAKVIMFWALLPQRCLFNDCLIVIYTLSNLLDVYPFSGEKKWSQCSLIINVLILFSIVKYYSKSYTRSKTDYKAKLVI